MKRPIARLSTNALVIAVVIVALFLAPAGQSVRADVIDVITTPIRYSPVCEVIVSIGSLGTISGVCPVEHSTKPAPAPPEPIRCTPARFTGPPMFFKNPIVTVKYIFHGSCSHVNLPNTPALNYRLEGSWTPGETNPNKPNASESLEITGYEPYMPDRAPGGRIFMYWTARCHREPWLSPEEARYQRLGAYIPDDLRKAVPDLHAMGSFPKTRNAIPVHERQRYYPQYLQLSSPATKLNPRVKAPERAATGVDPLVKAPSPPPPPMVEMPRQNAPITQQPALQTAPLSPSSVMQAPSPSSAPAQMNRSPFMVRPRGVEKGPTPHSEPHPAP